MTFIYRDAFNINASHDSVISATWIMIPPQKMDNRYKWHESIFKKMFNNKPERKGKPLMNYSFPLRLMFSIFN